MTDTPDRQLVTTLIEEAADNGCRRAAACAELDISLRTYQRWTREGATVIADGRQAARRSAPANKLSEEERARILALVNSPEFASQPPSQIVPALADRGEYLASESTIYRVMKAAAQQHHRGRAAYSAETGHLFRRKLDTRSSANWTPVPDQTGHLGRDDAGSRLSFYS